MKYAESDLENLVKKRREAEIFLSNYPERLKAAETILEEKQQEFLEDFYNQKIDFFYFQTYSFIRSIKLRQLSGLRNESLHGKLIQVENVWVFNLPKLPSVLSGGLILNTRLRS